MEDLHRTLKTLSCITTEIPEEYVAQCEIMRQVILLVDSYAAVVTGRQQLDDAENSIKQLEKKIEDLTNKQVRLRAHLLRTLDSLK